MIWQTLRTRSRVLIQDLADLWRGWWEAPAGRPAGRPIELFELEDRLMYSAAPAPMPQPEAAPTPQPQAMSAPSAAPAAAGDFVFSDAPQAPRSDVWDQLTQQLDALGQLVATGLSQDLQQSGDLQAADPAVPAGKFIFQAKPSTAAVGWLSEPT